MQNIIVLDDEKEIADLLEVYLTNEGYQVFKFYRAEGVLDCIRDNEISLAILDVMLPDIDGFQLCRKIRENWYFPIIMLTAKVEDVDKITGLSRGGRTIILRSRSIRWRLVARVKGQLRRSQTYNPSMSGQEEEESYNIRGLELVPNMHTCYLYGEKIDLPPIEYDILVYLCRHLGKVVSAEELFEAVWGEKYLNSNNTVMAHIARIREKLHENARAPKFIKTVWGVGCKMDRLRIRNRERNVRIYGG